MMTYLNKALKVRKTAGLFAVMLMGASSLGGCVSPIAGPHGVYATPMGSAPVIANPTAYSNALVCMGNYARARHLASPRMAVGRISDYTGRVAAEGGRAITQGASLMAMTALAKAGAHQVERFDTSVGEMELKYTNNRLITDSEKQNPNFPSEYRKIMSGEVTGSDFFIVGGITELNYNIRNSGADLFVGGNTATSTQGTLNGRLYVMNVALDLRLVDTRTFEVVDVISYQKQIIGREIKAGVFDFFHGNNIDVSAGEGGVEPMQLAVRSLIERATLEFMANLYGAPGPQVCLSAKDDYLNYDTNGLTGNLTPAYDNLGTNNGQTRSDPHRWVNTGTEVNTDDRHKRSVQTVPCQSNCVAVPAGSPPPYSAEPVSRY